jgi:hypothetical protein
MPRIARNFVQALWNINRWWIQRRTSRWLLVSCRLSHNQVSFSMKHSSDDIYWLLLALYSCMLSSKYHRILLAPLCQSKQYEIFCMGILTDCSLSPSIMIMGARRQHKFNRLACVKCIVTGDRCVVLRFMHNSRRRPNIWEGMRLLIETCVQPLLWCA